jgi:hypothetical protein
MGPLLFHVSRKYRAGPSTCYELLVTLGAFGHPALLFRIALARVEAAPAAAHVITQILQGVAVFSMEAAPLGMEIADELALS